MCWYNIHIGVVRVYRCMHNALYFVRNIRTKIPTLDFFHCKFLLGYLDLTFPNRWIGRLGPSPWPPRSPDLTPLHFFLSESIPFRGRRHASESYSILQALKFLLAWKCVVVILSSCYKLCKIFQYFFLFVGF